ncbi:MAG TPA: hypothetical protein DD473_14260 [Planctomycetaceae bacterium]|nr:hypothetical protein [Planctomycetaceae bacterium]
MGNSKAVYQGALLSMGFCLIAAVTTNVEAQGKMNRGKNLRQEDRARPGTWDHVDELAVDLANLAQDLHDEVHVHLEGHQYFRHIDGHAEKIEELSEHIHDLAHEGGNIRHLREDVIELDEEVHHADGVITDIARKGVRARDFDGGVRQTRRIVDAMIAILHHLEEDLTEMDPSYRNARYRPDIDDHLHNHRRPSEDYHDRYPGRYDSRDRYYYNRSPGHMHHNHIR